MDLTNRKQRGVIFKGYDGHCFYCGRELDAFGDWHIDHANPKSKGGTDDEDNLRLACHTCNIVKSDRTVEEYRAYLTDRYAEKLTNNIEALKTVFRVYRFPLEFVFKYFTMLGVIVDRLERPRIEFYGEGGEALVEPSNIDAGEQSRFDFDGAVEQLREQFGFDRDSGESKDEKE